MDTISETQQTTKLLTAREVAQLLSVSKEWVYHQSRAGGMPVVRLGRYRRYRRDAIEAWIAEIEDRGAGLGPSQVF